MTRSLPRSWQAGLSAVVTAIAVAYLVVSIRSNWDTLTSLEWSPSLVDLLALVLFVVAVPLSGVLWVWLLGLIVERKVPVTSGVLAHIQSWLLKYVPGQLGSLGGKVLWGTNNGYPAGKVSASFAYETIFHTSASLIVGLPAALILVPGSRSDYVPLVILLVVLQLGIAISPYILKVVPVPVLQRLGQYSIGTIDAGKLQTAYIAPRLLNAVGFVLLAGRFDGVNSVSDVVTFGAVYVLAGIIGILAFMVPSGIGVREAVIAALLAGSLGSAEALGLAAIARVVATLADIVLALVLLTQRKRLDAVAPVGES